MDTFVYISKFAYPQILLNESKNMFAKRIQDQKCQKKKKKKKKKKTGVFMPEKIIPNSKNIPFFSFFLKYCFVFG